MARQVLAAMGVFRNASGVGFAPPPSPYPPRPFAAALADPAVVAWLAAAAPGQGLWRREGFPGQPVPHPWDRAAAARRAAALGLGAPRAGDVVAGPGGAAAGVAAAVEGREAGERVFVR